MSDFLARLREKNQSRIKRWHPPGTVPWTSADWSNAMQGESGEAGNVVKKIRRAETRTGPQTLADIPVLIGHLGDELADTIIYADLLAAYYGIDLQAAIARKFDAVSVREGYPERLIPTPEQVRQHHSVGSSHGFCNHGELPGECGQVPT